MTVAATQHPNSFKINHLSQLFPQKSRKSNAALLLPHLFPVSPLLRYSYKKMGGAPLTPNCETVAHQPPTSNSFNPSHLGRFCTSPPHVSPLDSYSCRKQ